MSARDRLHSLIPEGQHTPMAASLLDAILAEHRAEVLREAADALDTWMDSKHENAELALLGIHGPWTAVEKAADELRRMADEAGGAA